jgi:hypothetical protein
MNVGVLLRWAALLPATLMAWYAAFITGLLLLSAVDSLCPSHQQVSGMCVAPWYPWVSQGVFCFSAAMAAACVVVSAWLVAPGKKSATAWVAFAVGSLVAIGLGWSLRAWLELGASLIGGAFTTRLLVRPGVAARDAAAESR